MMRRIVGRAARRDTKTNVIEVQAAIEEIQMDGDKVLVLRTAEEITLRGTTIQDVRAAANAHLQGLARADADAQLSERVVGRELARL